MQLPRSAFEKLSSRWPNPRECPGMQMNAIAGPVRISCNITSIIPFGGNKDLTEFVAECILAGVLAHRIEIEVVQLDRSCSNAVACVELQFRESSPFRIPIIAVTNLYRSPYWLAVFISGFLLDRERNCIGISKFPVFYRKIQNFIPRFVQRI